MQTASLDEDDMFAGEQPVVTAENGKGGNDVLPDASCEARELKVKALPRLMGPIQPSPSAQFLHRSLALAGLTLPRPPAQHAATAQPHLNTTCSIKAKNTDIGLTNALLESSPVVPPRKSIPPSTYVSGRARCGGFEVQIHDDIHGYQTSMFPSSKDVTSSFPRRKPSTVADLRKVFENPNAKFGPQTGRTVPSIQKVPIFHSQSALLTPVNSNTSLFFCSNASSHAANYNAGTPRKSCALPTDSERSTPRTSSIAKEAPGSPLKDRIRLFESLSRHEKSPDQSNLTLSKSKTEPKESWRKTKTRSTSKTKLKAFVQSGWRRFSRSRNSDNAQAEKLAKGDDSDEVDCQERPDSQQINIVSAYDGQTEVPAMPVAADGYRHVWPWGYGNGGKMQSRSALQWQGHPRHPSGSRHRMRNWSWSRRPTSMSYLVAAQVEGLVQS